MSRVLKIDSMAGVIKSRSTNRCKNVGRCGSAGKTCHLKSDPFTATEGVIILEAKDQRIISSVSGGSEIAA